MNDRLTIATALAAAWLNSFRGPDEEHPAGIDNSEIFAEEAVTLADALIAREAATRPAELGPMKWPGSGPVIAPAEPRRVLLGPDEAQIIYIIYGKFLIHKTSRTPAPSFALTIEGGAVTKVEVAD